MHLVLHTPITASSQDPLTPANSQSLISLRHLLCSAFYVCTIMGLPINRVSAPVVPSSEAATFTSTPSKYSSNLDQWWPPTASPNPLNQSLHVPRIIASKCISNVAWLQLPSALRSIINLCLQVYLQTPSIKAFEYISMFKWCSFCEMVELQQRNGFLPLGTSASVWELSDQNRKVVKSHSVQDGCRGVLVNLGAPAKNLCGQIRSDDNQGSTWDHRKQAWVHQAVPMTPLAASDSANDNRGRTWDRQRQVWKHVPSL